MPGRRPRGHRRRAAAPRQRAGGDPHPRRRAWRPRSGPPCARRPGPCWIGYAVPGEGRHQMCCWDSGDSAGTGCSGCRLEGEGSFTVSGKRDRTGDRRCRWKATTRSSSCSGPRAGSSIASGRTPRLRARRGRPAGRVARRRAPRGERQAPALAHLHRPRTGEAGQAGRGARARGPRLPRRSLRPRGPHRHRAPGREPAHAGARRSSGSPSGPARRRRRSSRARIEDDPETEVKKRAVFALSQLPHDEGVPLLIDTARKNRNPAVRKQAMFWLGQSNDPRALAFFEDVLKP